MRTILIILTISISLSGFTQNLKNLNHWQAKRFAQSAIRAGDTYNAIKYLERYSEIKTNDSKALVLLGNLYKSVRDYENAMYNYKKAYKLNPEKNVNALFYYAQMQKITGNYIESLENFEAYNKNARGLSSEKNRRKLAKNEIEGIELLNQEENKVVQIQRLNYDINSYSSEQSPLLLNDTTLIYVSSDSLHNTNFKIARLINNEWINTDEKFFDKDINFKYVGNGALSSDNNKFFFTYCNENWQNKLICHIYYMEKVNNNWSNPVKLENNINLTNYTSTQPTIGKNEKGNEVLYFVSDRKGTRGKLDIWYSEFDNRLNTFKEPKNLGSKINSKENEITPYYSENDKSLFYSSDGLVGLGGYDIYQSIGECRKWTVAENIGSPINSSYDDVYFKTYNNSGFLVSNRTDANFKSSCCDDIFSFNFSKINKIVLKGFLYALNNATYESIKNSDDNYFINKKEVKLYLTEDNEDFLVASTLSNEMGEYEFQVDRNKQYKVKVTSMDKTEEIAFNTNLNPEQDLLAMEPIQIIPFDNTPIRINNIYYEFDQASLTEQSKRTLDTTLVEILLKNPGVRIEIASHTDSKGEDDYNLNLSQKRAESVINYLVEKGISKSRLEANGYGEMSPIASNENDTGREQNRRTEFKIIGLDNNYLSQNINKED